MSDSSDSGQQANGNDRTDRALDAFVANWLHQLSERHEAEPPPKA